MQSTTPETTAAPTAGETTTAGGTTVVLEPSQLQAIIDQNAANTYAIMLGIGLVLLFVSVLAFIEVNTGRGG